MEPTQPQTSPIVSPTPALNYASFGRRWAASFLDGVILGFAGFFVNLPFVIVGTMFGAASSSSDPTAANLFGSIFVMIGNLINVVVGIAYYVYFIGKDGQTLGKRVLGVKVIRQNGEPCVGYVNAFLRETVGKFVSAIIFFIGFLIMLWDKDKQTLHDKIAGTVVVKV